MTMIENTSISIRIKKESTSMTMMRKMSVRINAENEVLNG
jgi:hypothetical protein